MNLQNVFIAAFWPRLEKEVDCKNPASRLVSPRIISVECWGNSIRKWGNLGSIWERLLDSLARKERRLRDAIISSEDAKAVAKSRQQLLGGGLADLGTTGFGDVGGGGGRSNNDFGGAGFGEAVGGFSRANDFVENDVTRGVTTQAIKQSQEDALAQQDAGLDMLHTIIVRQKGMAQQIGNEVNSQNELIDDIGDRMDGTNARLLDTTQNVRVVDRKDKTCGYWIVIIILFIAIVVVAVI